MSYSGVNIFERSGWWRVPSGVERIYFFCRQSQQHPPKHLEMWYYASFKGDGVFVWSFALLYIYSFVSSSRIVCFSYTDKSGVFERNQHILTPLMAWLFTESARSRRIVPENSVLVIRSARWTWERYYRL